MHEAAKQIRVFLDVQRYMIIYSRIDARKCLTLISESYAIFFDEIYHLLQLSIDINLKNLFEDLV